MKSINFYQTNGIYQACKQDEKFHKEIITAFTKYFNYDWGDTCKEDKKINDNAVKNGNDRIVAKYITSKGNIFIITEIDMTITTILFADEY